MLQPLLARTGPINARLTGLNLFRGGKDGDVLHVEIESPELEELHHAVAGAVPLPGNTHPEFKPHCTLAYLRPEAAELYLDESPPFLGRTVTLTVAEYAGPDGGREEIPLSFLPQLGLSEKALSWINPLFGGAFVPPPQQGDKPAGCTCNWPREKFRNGSGHRDDCPIHAAWLARGGFGQTGRKVFNSPFKSISGYLTKGKGEPCKQGETSEKTECVPESGKTRSKAKKEEVKSKEEAEIAKRRRNEKAAGNWIYRWRGTPGSSTLPQEMPNYEVSKIIQESRPTEPMTLYRWERVDHDPMKTDMSTRIPLQLWCTNGEGLQEMIDEINEDIDAGILHQPKMRMLERTFQPHEIYAVFEDLPQGVKDQMHALGSERDDLGEVLVFYYRPNLPSPFKSLPFYLTKERGAPCKPGENTRGGCIPQSHDAGQPGSNSTQQQPSPQSASGQPDPFKAAATMGKAVFDAGFGVPKEKLASLLKSIPDEIKAPITNLWHMVHGILMAGNHAAQALAREVARGKGLSDAEVTQLGATLSAIDATFQGGAMATAAGTAAVAPAVALAAKAASYLPVASTAYILTSAGRNPVVTAKAAWMLLREKFPDKMKGAAQFAWGSVRHPLTMHGEGHKAMDKQNGGADAALIAEHLAKAKDRDWWLALFSAALDEVRDVAEACKMADAAANPVWGKPGPSPYGKGLLNYQTKGESYFSECERDEEGRCLPSGEASSGKEEARQEAPKKDTPESRGKKILKEAAAVQFSDEVVNSESVEANDYDAIREAMSSDELDEMREYLQEAANSFASELSDDDLGLDERDVANEAGLGWDEVTDRIMDAVRLHGGENAEELADSLEWERNAYGSDLVEETIAQLEDAPQELIASLNTLYQKISSEMNKAHSEAREQAESEYVNDYDTWEDEREYLHKFHRDHEERFTTIEDFAENTWHRDADDDGICKFKISSGAEYTVMAVSRNKEFAGDRVEDLQFSDTSGSFSITNAGNAFEVFAKIVPAMTAYVQHEDKNAVTFTADEPSRQKLYDRLVRTMTKTLPEYNAYFVDTKGKRMYVVVKSSLEREFFDELPKFGISQGGINQLSGSKKSLDSGEEPPKPIKIEPEIDPDWWTPDAWEPEDDDAPSPPVIPPSPFKKSMLNYQTKDKGTDCHWVTMPANGEGGGGSPVCIDGSGNISKGPKNTVGKKPSELKKKPAPQVSKPSPFAKKEKPKAPAVEKKLKYGIGDKVNTISGPAKIVDVADGKYEIQFEGSTSTFKLTADQSQDFDQLYHKFNGKHPTEELTPEKKPDAPAAEPSTAEKPEYVGKPINVSTSKFHPPKRMVGFGKKAIDGLKPNQIAAIAEYTDLSYEDLNKAMRECPPEFTCVKGPERKLMQEIESALEAASPFPDPVLVYRGLNMLPETVQDMLNAAKQVQNEGSIFRMPSIISTSLDPATSYLRFGSTLTDRCIIFQIKAKRGLYVNSISEHKEEHEVIQSAKTRYKVVGVEEVQFIKNSGAGNIRNVIYLEEID